MPRGKAFAIAGVAAGVLAALGILIGNWLDSPDPAPIMPAIPETVAGAPEPAPAEVIELSSETGRIYREVSYPEIPLMVRIPEDWTDRFDSKKRVCQFGPPGNHPDAGLVWTEVRPISNRRDFSQEEIVKALTASVTGLPDLKIESFVPVETRPGGELVTRENPAADGELTLESVFMEIRYTDEKTGRPFRGHSIASSQSDDRGAWHYITLLRCDVDRWEAYTDVFAQFLGNMKVGFRPK